MAELRFINERGVRPAIEMYGPGGDEHQSTSMTNWAAKVDDEWAQIICDFSMNGMYARDIITTSQRELCAVAALTAMGEMDALASHIRIALRSNTMPVVREVIVQMGVLAGMPLALKALRLMGTILAEDAS
ncbi:MAG: carboxymuconolactone decarboxylase family protein [Actinomycetota bacterium]